MEPACLQPLRQNDGWRGGGGEHPFQLPVLQPSFHGSGRIGTTLEAVPLDPRERRVAQQRETQAPLPGV